MQVLADGTLTVDAPAATSTRGLVVLFTGTSFVSAFLLFLVQPMVAKLVLPSYGGSPEDRLPALWLLLVLVVAVGGPFVAVSTTGPLPQRWFSMADHERADDLGLAGRVRRDAPVSNADGTVGSWWVVLAADDAHLAALDADDRWDRFEGLPRHLWTDAHSDLLSVLGVDRPSEADG